jgi:asparagine synthase (glutamine-hydrolysing)
LCGIAGLISRSVDQQSIKLMCDSLSHRGPDAQGIWTGKGIALGHTRLSILDPEPRSNQPFVKNGLVIVFNGEIYNYKAIRDSLSGFCEFETASDTEVVLEAWRRWGTSCLENFRGMYAFAIHEFKSGKTWIVRDPFGIKPLFYYSASDGRVAFASELKALEVVFRTEFEVDETAIAASLLFCWIPEDKCIWKQVRKLEPGCYLEIEPNRNPERSRYFHPDKLLGQETITDLAQATSMLDDALYDSVKSHLVADVPVSAFLSGGVDSSLIVAMASSLNPDIECYTIKFRDADKSAEAMADDAYYAAIVAKELGVKLHTIEVQPDLVELLPKIVHHLDEPIGDSAAISTFLICEAARERGVKVLLSGMGADEMFGGYRKHLANIWAMRYRKLPSFARQGLASATNSLPVQIGGKGLVFSRWGKRFLSFADLPEADAFLRSYTYHSHLELEKLMPEVGAKAYGEIAGAHHSLYERASGKGHLDQMCYTDLNMFMVSLNEAYTDRASMAASTEVRVPFIDKEVVSLAFKFASTLKLNGGVSKHVLKKVAENWLPHHVVHRKKSSFTLPLRSWINSTYSEVVDEMILSRDGLAGRAMMDGRILQKIVESNRSGVDDNSQKIWQLLTLEQWLRNHGI